MIVKNNFKKNIKENKIKKSKYIINHYFIKLK